MSSSVWKAWTAIIFPGVAAVGIPIDIDDLRQAGIETCDAVAIATPDDSVNIMVAQIAKTSSMCPGSSPV